MSAELSKFLEQRYTYAQGKRAPWEQVWQQLRDLFDPFRGDIKTKRSPGSKRINPQFDSTGSISADRFTNFMHGAVFPASGDWIRIGPARGSYRTDRDFRIALDRTANRELDELRSSNFYSVAGEWLKELIVLCTSILFVEEKDPRPYREGKGTFGGLHFTHVPLQSVYLESGKYGEITNIYREITMPAMDAYEKWGDRCGPKLIEALGKDPMQDFKFLNCCFPRKAGIPGVPTVKTQMPWANVVLGMDTGLESSKVVYEGGYRVKPFVVGRWGTIEDQIYGVGPGYMGRGEAGGKQEIRRQILMAIPQELRPMLMVENDSVFNVDYEPGALLSVKMKKMEPRFLRSGADFRAAEEVGGEMGKNIKKAFLEDQTELPQMDRMTAQEVVQRRQAALVQMAVPSIKIEQFLAEAEGITRDMMLDGGALPELEQALAEDDAEIDIRFISPLATAQKEATRVPIDQWVMRRIQIFQNTQNPEVLDRIDWDGWDRVDSEMANVPGEVVASDEMVEAKRQARAQQAQMAQIQSAAETAAKVAGKAPGLIEGMMQ